MCNFFSLSKIVNEIMELDDTGYSKLYDTYSACSNSKGIYELWISISRFGKWQPRRTRRIVIDKVEYLLDRWLLISKVRKWAIGHGTVNEGNSIWSKVLMMGTMKGKNRRINHLSSIKLRYIYESIYKGLGSSLLL